MKNCVCPGVLSARLVGEGSQWVLLKRDGSTMSRAPEIDTDEEESSVREMLELLYDNIDLLKTDSEYEFVESMDEKLANNKFLSSRQATRVRELYAKYSNRF